MVRHGRTKKRRAGRYGRTKLKNRSWNRWDPNPKVAKELKEKWDPGKTPAANLEAFGLRSKPDHGRLGGSSSSANTTDQEASAASNASCAPSNDTFIELFDVPDSDNAAATTTSFRERYPLDRKEEEYIAKCMSKWGDDYRSMFRDTKDVNHLQHTENKLRKLGARYLLLTAEQRRVDVPANILDLLPTTSSSSSGK